MPMRPTPAAPPAPRRVPLGHRVRAVARVACYLVFAFALASGLALRSVWADVKESALGVGRELAAFGDLGAGAHVVRLNGEPLLVASTTTEAPIDAVLDRLAVACRAHAGGLDLEVERLPEALAAPLRPRVASGEALGIVRQQSDHEGMIACLAHEGQGGYAALVERLRAFSATGDLASVGKLRYVYAERRDARTHVVAVWTEAALRIGRIVPLDGVEPPGDEPRGAPRPEGARRILSASVEGAPHAVHLFDVPGAPDAAVEAYAARLPALGWSPARATSGEVPAGRVFTHAGADLWVVGAARGDRSVLTLVEVGAR